MIYEEIIRWHEVVTRPPTDTEAEEFFVKYDYIPSYIFNCKLPDDGQEILIATKWGVDKDICGIDNTYGYYLEDRGDWDDVIAWAEMPKYKAGEE